jgi:Holliday junction resolvase RusA-like endonuclease
VTAWGFSVLGSPAPQGSKRHVGHGVMVESSKKVLPWREAVKAAAPAGPMLDGPIAVKLIFTVPRPKAARKTELHPYRIPDLSKLVRSTEDAITDAGLWADDARVSEYQRLAKVWPAFDPDALHTPGCVIAAVEMIGDYWQAELLEVFRQALSDRRSA